MIKINDKYKLLFDPPENVRYFIVTGGRGSSKSFTVNVMLCLLTFTQHVKILFTRYTLTSAKISIIPEFIEKIELINGLKHFDITKDEIINNYANTSILFKGLKTSSGNQTANLKSLQGVSCWVLDEAEELNNEETFDTIDLSVRSNNAKNLVILVLNPATKRHWIYKRFFESKGIKEGFNGVKDDCCYIHTSYLDNKENLPDSFLRSIENIKRTNPNKYKHKILGGWLDKVEGVIFEKYSTGHKFDESKPYIYGLDFGYSVDPTALVRVQRINDKLLVEELIYKRNLTNSDICKELTNLGVNSNDLIIADSAEPKSIEDLKRAGFRVEAAKKGKDSINNGIDFIKDHSICIVGESNNLVNELSLYCWDKNKSTGEMISKPIDDYNHLIDAFRYANESFKKSKIITI